MVNAWKSTVSTWPNCRRIKGLKFRDDEPPLANSRREQCPDGKRRPSRRRTGNRPTNCFRSRAGRRRTASRWRLATVRVSWRRWNAEVPPTNLESVPGIRSSRLTAETWRTCRRTASGCCPPWVWTVRGQGSRSAEPTAWLELRPPVRRRWAWFRGSSTSNSRQTSVSATGWKWRALDPPSSSTSNQKDRHNELESDQVGQPFSHHYRQQCFYCAYYKQRNARALQLSRDKAKLKH